MKLLKDLLPTEIIETVGDMNVEVSGVCFDSRKVKKGDLFVALNGNNIDGCSFLFDAISHGASAVLIEGNRKNVEVPLIKVRNARSALSEVSAKFYDNPSEKIKLIGITGTKGKTTIHLLIGVAHERNSRMRVGQDKYFHWNERSPACI